jgi:DNA (cytosine-5)-methyltransferase 1
VNLTAVDLFAGAGGFSAGAEMAGYEVTDAVEIDEWACETLSRNHPSTTVHCSDIRELSQDWIEAELPSQPDLLVGGPPCQGFSHAGPARKDPKDPRNSLFKEFVRFAKVLKPKLVVMENVPGILRAKTHAGESVAKIVEEELAALGYGVRRYVLEAERFGVPQIRRRVFFVGSSEAELPLEISPTHGPALDLFSAQGPILTVRDAISDLPVVNVGDATERIIYEGPPTNTFQLAMRAGAGDELHNHKPMRHSRRMIERFEQIRPGQSQRHVSQADLAPRRRIRRAENEPVAYDQNNRRMFWDRPCHTLAASFYANFVHPELHRNFTPREGARIQTFPDRYVFEGKPTVVSTKLLTREGRHAERHLCQYNQIGNAVPPRLGFALLAALRALSPEDEVLAPAVANA